nr:MAG TPA: hypothetical protein [Caudoviricetes sp.]
MKVLIRNNKVILADGQAIKWQSGGDTPLKVLTHNNKLLLTNGQALRNLKLPAAYTELPYLVATDNSKAWIDTGIPYQNGCKIEIKTTLYGNSNLFGVFYTTARCRGYWSSGTAIFNIGPAANDAIYPQIAGYSINDTVVWTCTANTDTKDISIIIGDKSDIRTASQSSTIAYDTSPYNIYLFAVNRTNAETAVQGTRIIHYFKYWDNNGNLLLDLIPVERKSDGVLGMYNQVDGRFLTNISTGTFYKEVPASADEEIDDMEIV